MSTPAAAPRPVVAYLRVSSRAQDHATQRSAIERAAAARGEVVSVWYAEKRSGKTMDRAELRQVRADARAGRIGTLYVYRLDRLTRSGIRDTLEVVEELREAGVTLRTVADGFDPSGPAAQLILAVMAWAAQMERLAIGERVADARERVAAEGGAWGRPPRFTPQMVETASAMQREGRSVREISVALKVPRATVGRCLKKVAVSQNARSEGNPAPQPPASR